MSTMRSALVDLRYASSANVESFDLLLPTSEGKPKRFSAKPDMIDDHVDHVIDPTKWSTTGVVTEATYLGVDGLLTVDPVTPDWDAAGMIYKPAIAAQIGKMVFARAIAAHPVEVMFSLQEYDFTVDSVALPTTWTLGYKVSPQDLRNSIGLIWRAGSLYFFEGGQPGNEEFVAQAPWRGSSATATFPLQVAFIFNATGWDIWAHLPGIWDHAVLVKSYVRPGGTHCLFGYSLCINKFTADDSLLFYNMAFGFKSNALLTGGRIVTASSADYVYPSSMQFVENVGVNSSLPGNIRVRFPGLGTTLYTPAQLAQVTTKLLGRQIHEVEFELSGDVSLDHPVRINIDDATLVAPPAPQAT